jgi:hypothetical protein
MSDPMTRDQLGDWEQFPPKSEWDVKRRSLLAFITDAEKQLAKLRAQVAEHPHDNPPDAIKALKMMESARPAARYATDCDTILQEVVDAEQGTSLADTSQEDDEVPLGVPTEINGSWFYRTPHTTWVLRVADDSRFHAGRKPVWVFLSLADPMPDFSKMED